MEVGFILYHELIHMVSQAGDADVGYAKESLVNLANSNAEAARMSANNYMLYVAQNGLSYANYSAISGGWGMMIHDPYCVDSYSNCLDMASDCCGGNNDLLDWCCATCAVVDSTQDCIDQYGMPANGFQDVYADNINDGPTGDSTPPTDITPPAGPTET